ncbi:MAG: ParB/RepB/Spo0J family partition protein [Nitrososphaeria archaeon]|nr:ParB/RepB/Spo0J family partition protein [Nitrososphaeria archaeon]NIQ34168.1 ParB/RepB/Spo0J family partition protein [Nitrososphaeria archaeon]
MSEEIPVELVDVAPENMNFGEESRENSELRQNIKRVGQLQNVVVREEDGRYLVLIGKERLKAAKEAGLKTIAAKVVDTKGYEAMLMSASENIHRKNVDPVVRAKHIKRMVEESGKSLRGVARDLKVPVSVLSEYLKILELDESLQRLISEGKLSYKVGVKIARAGNPPEEQKRLAEAIEHGESMDDLSKFFKIERRGAPRGLHVLRFTWGDDERQFEEHIRSEALRLGVKPGDYAKGMLKEAIKERLKNK